MSSKITADSLLNGHDSITRGEAYKSLEEKGYLPIHDSKLARINYARSVGITLVASGAIFAAITFLTFLSVNMHQAGVPFYSIASNPSFGIGTYAISGGVFALGLIILVVASVKKRDHSNEQLNKTGLQAVLKELKAEYGKVRDYIGRDPIFRAYKQFNKREAALDPS